MNLESTKLWAATAWPRVHAKPVCAPASKHVVPTPAPLLYDATHSFTPNAPATMMLSTIRSRRSEKAKYARAEALKHRDVFVTPTTPDNDAKLLPHLDGSWISACVALNPKSDFWDELHPLEAGIYIQKSGDADEFIAYDEGDVVLLSGDVWHWTQTPRKGVRWMLVVFFYVDEGLC